MNKVISLGVDIGGSHISAAAVDMNSGSIIDSSYCELKVENKASANLILSQWCKCIRLVMNQIGDIPLGGIGLAVPGPFDYSQGISLIAGVDKYEAIYGLNIQQAIRTGLNLNETIPVRFINDAMGFAIGETWVGAAHKFSRNVIITLGTGFGSAFMIGGVPQKEGVGVPPEGYLYCCPFDDSIADEYFSTRWFIKKMKLMTGKTCSGVKEIAESVRDGVLDNTIFREFGSNLAVLLYPFLKEFDADMLVIGGNISRAFDLFEPYLSEKLRNKNIGTKVISSTLKDYSAILGSARLIDPDFWGKIQISL